MKVKPIENFKLLGTSIELEKGKEYPASHATNQPDWQEKGLIFIHERENDPVGVLLAKGEYEIVE